MALTEPSKPSTLPAMPLVTFCMIFEIRKRIAREDGSGAGHARPDALGRAWEIRLRFLAPPPLQRLHFFEATDGTLGWICGSPSPSGAASSPAAEADGAAAGAPDAPGTGNLKFALLTPGRGRETAAQPSEKSVFGVTRK